jgi:hypothetical protein
MKRLFIICIIGVIALGCIPSIKINYIGATYSSSSNVDIYFSENDVQRDYVIMGQAEALQIYDEPNIAQISQNELIKEAHKRGADGIIFKELKTSTTAKTNIYATFIKYK